MTTDPHAYISGARRLLRLLGLRPQIRFAYQARSIRYGLLEATGHEITRPRMISWRLYVRAYVRARVRQGHSRRVAIAAADLAPLLDWMDAKLRPAGLSVDRTKTVRRRGMLALEYSDRDGRRRALVYVTTPDVEFVDLYLDRNADFPEDELFRP